MDRLQPNSLNCFVCGVENTCGLGLKFYNTADDEVTATFTPPERYQGYPGVLHGGIVAAVLDETAGRTQMAADPNHFMVTVKLEIRYRRPVPVGQPLTIYGRLIKRGGRLNAAHAEIRLHDGTVAAEAEVLLADAPAGIFGADAGDLERLGWQVYPD